MLCGRRREESSLAGAKELSSLVCCARCFLGGRFAAADSAAEVEQGQHHDDKTGPEADGQALAEACHNIADKAADGNNAGIGHLRGDVFDMRTGRAGAGQNGGVRNGRTVVAEDAARKGGGQGDQHQAAVGVDDLRHGHDNGDQDAEGSPGSAGGEAEEARQNEDDGGEKAAGKAAVGNINLFGNSALTSYIRTRDGQGENDVRIL